MPGLHFLLKADREMVSYDRSFIHDKQSEQRLKLYGLFGEMVKKLVALCFAGKKKITIRSLCKPFTLILQRKFSPRSRLRRGRGGQGRANLDLGLVDDGLDLDRA